MPAFTNKILLGLPFLILALLLGCSDGDGGGQSCTDGTANCACYTNQTCNEGLDCVEGTCVDPNAPLDAGGDPGDVDGHQDATVEPPDCTELVPLRQWKSDPSAIATLFTVEDCATGEAVPGLRESAFAISEDNRPLSSEAVPTILPSRGVRVYVTLMLDMSSSTQSNLAELQAGAKRFVDQILVEQALDNVYIGLEAFDGSDSPMVVEMPTSDADELKTSIDGLPNFDGVDPGATNLNGAARHGVEDVQERQRLVMERNHGGVVTTGYMVLFTDGGDSAGIETPDGAKSAIAEARVYDRFAGAQPTVRTLAVALEGQDYDRDALSNLVGGPQWVLESDLAQLENTFQEVGGRIAKRVRGTYLLAFCSSSRAGDHTVTLEMAEGESNTLSYDFNADSFGPGCSAEFFETACDTMSCGGFNCGACDDATAVCDGAESGQCVSACLDANRCGGQTWTNDLGYEQICDLGEATMQCGGQCTDTSTDKTNCGACGNVCPGAESQCIDGQCLCDGGSVVCTTPQVSAGGAHTCALKTNGTVRCWGDNGDGRLDAPQGTLTHVSAGGGFTCGLRPDGTAACWGNDYGGQSSPPNTTFVDISAGNSHACGLKADGHIECWGGEPYPGENTFVDISAGSNTCGVTTDGQLDCWGPFHGGISGGNYVQVAYGNSDDGCALTASGDARCWEDGWYGIQDAPSESFVQLSVGSRHACGVTTSGSVLCWGDNGYGQSMAPQGQFTQVSAGLFHTCGLKSDATVVCWGNDEDGQVTPPADL